MQITSGHGLDTLGATPATRLGSGGTTLIAPTSAAVQVATTRSSTLLYARPAFLSIPLGSLGTVAVRGKAYEGWGEAPKKCSTFLGGFSHKIIITSTTPIVTPEFSSDLERAPGARSIADENSGVTFGVVELRRCEAYEHFRSHPVLLGTLPPAWIASHQSSLPNAAKGYPP